MLYVSRRLETFILHRDWWWLSSYLGGLECVVSWCMINCLQISVSKCKVMGLFKCKCPVNSNYFINDTILEIVDNFNYVDVILSSDLSFNLYIFQIILKSTRMRVFFIDIVCVGKCISFIKIRKYFLCLLFIYLLTYISFSRRWDT